MSSTPPSLSDLRIDREAERAPAPKRGGLLPWALGLAIAVAAALAIAKAPRSIPVEAAPVTMTGGAQAGGSGITANGYVVARTKASVSAKTAGRMEYLGVHEGSHVKRGQVMARIEAGVYRAQVEATKAQVAEAEAQLVQAKRDLERAKALRARDLIADSDLENASTKVNVWTATVASAHAEKRLADENVENTLVRAPFDGTVLRKDAEVGEIVAPASAGGGLTRTSIVTMADLTTLEVEVDVNEAYIAQIRGGQSARITLDAYSDTSFAGSVRQVVPTADRQKATVLVKVSILDRDPRILPEMAAKVVFDRSSGASPAAPPPVRIVAPPAALVRDGGRTFVWVIDHGRVSAHTVELGRESEGGVDVRSGLLGGESLVLKPPAGLKEGAKVRVVKG